MAVQYQRNGYLSGPGGGIPHAILHRRGSSFGVCGGCEAHRPVESWGCTSHCARVTLCVIPPLLLDLYGQSSSYNGNMSAALCRLLIESRRSTHNKRSLCCLRHAGKRREPCKRSRFVALLYFFAVGRNFFIFCLFLWCIYAMAFH